jgi:hypothetical protein
MSNQKRSRGRPSGVRYPRRFLVYENDRGMDLLRGIAHQRDTTQAEVIRQLIREEAERSGLAAGDEAPAPNADWQERFRRLLAKAQGSDTGDLTPEELEREVTLAREEVRAEDREAASAGRD